MYLTSSCYDSFSRLLTSIGKEGEMVFKRRSGSRSDNSNPARTSEKEEAMLGRDRDAGYTPAEDTYTRMDSGNGTVLSILILTRER